MTKRVFDAALGRGNAALLGLQAGTINHSQALAAVARARGEIAAGFRAMGYDQAIVSRTLDIVCLFDNQHEMKVIDIQEARALCS